MKHSLLVAIGFLLVFAGCYNEDDIQVTEGLEVSYTLPQGDHPFDATIMNWYEQYGFYTLYIFEDKDIYWANTNWDERFDVGDSRGGGSLRGNPADPNYVEGQLDLFEEAFMSLYPDSLIDKYMPLKLLLCSDLWNVAQVFDRYDPELGMIMKLDSTKLWAREGWDYIAINGGSAEMAPMTVEDKENFQAELNSIFIQRLYSEGVLEIPEAFGTVSDYSTQGYYTGTSIPSIFELGFVHDNPLGSFSSGFDVMVEADFEAYLPLLAKPMSWLTATPGPVYEYDATGYSILILKGVLHPDRDMNGLIRQKYDILMNMLEEKGIDIQRLQYPEFD